MSGGKELSALIDLTYEAVLDNNLWPSVLIKLADAVGAAHPVMPSIDWRANTFATIAPRVDPDLVASYKEYWAFHDPVFGPRLRGVLQPFLSGQWSFVLLNVHRVGEMLFILKTLLVAPSPKKLDVYQTQFEAVFKSREPLFDQLFGLLAAFYNAYQEFLKPEALLARLNEGGQIKLVYYLSNLLADAKIPIYSDGTNQNFDCPTSKRVCCLWKRLCPSIVVWSIISPSCIRWNRSEDTRSGPITTISLRASKTS